MKQETEAKLRCPFCKYHEFLRQATDIVELFDREGNRDEYLDGWPEAYRYYCFKCKREVTDVKLRR